MLHNVDMIGHNGDIISWDTNLDLHQEAERYGESVLAPHFMPVGKFAVALTGVALADPRTLISGDQEVLAVALTGKGIEETFATIYLAPDRAASLNMFGPHEEDRLNPVRRRLTESEGRALIADLKEIIAATPRD